MRAAADAISLAFLLALLSVGFSTPSTRQGPLTRSENGSSDRLLFVSTLDGRLRAVDASTGKTKWTITDEPVIRLPVSVRSGYTFVPDPQDGSLYALAEGRLKKLPFTIPELVQASPCRSSDGILYAGSKRDSWLSIDTQTGEKLESLTGGVESERFCPASTQNTIHLGRTQYHITMFDSQSRQKRWNATFVDYTSSILPEDTSYRLAHMSSSSADGRLATVDGDTGELLWLTAFESPVVALYVLETNGLHRLPFSVLGDDTLMDVTADDQYPALVQQRLRDALKQLRPQQMAAAQSNKVQASKLYRTLYVGESSFGLYALPAFVDAATVTIQSKHVGPPLLDGPSPIQEVSATDDVDRPHVYIDPEMAQMSQTTVDGEFLVLGHHDPPDAAEDYQLIVQQQPMPPVNPVRPDRQIAYVVPTSGDSAGHDSHSTMPTQVVEVTLEALFLQFVERHSTFVGTVVVTIGLVILGSLWLCIRQPFLNPSSWSTSTSAHQSRQSAAAASGGGLWFSSTADSVPEGWMACGKVLFDPSHILGRGCEGTVVYRGRFDGRDVAVKRVVAEFLSLADREVDLLRETDMHTNVIRYFCMESDSQFRYIALELCWASLQDFVDKPAIRHQCPLTAMQILEQATHGLAHLHSLKIVHRDMKPQNVLLSQPDAQQRVRVLISDFGLCKKLSLDRNSLSRRSGLAGTDGWIAPEALENDRSLTRSVDMFSLGCVLYYVLTLGAHPFGDSWRRQANIIAGDYCLDKLDAAGDDSVGVSLIELLLSRDPSLRPTAAATLKHPFFWSKQRALAFLQDVSDRVEKECPSALVVLRLEHQARRCVKHDWRRHLCPHLQDDLRKFRTYRGHSVRDLLRAMRNKKHHYRELPVELRESLGGIPDQFMTYFAGRFPLLLPQVYLAMELCRDEAIFSGYYDEQYEFSAGRFDDLVRPAEPLLNLDSDGRRSRGNSSSSRGGSPSSGSPLLGRKVPVADQGRSDRDANWRRRSPDANRIPVAADEDATITPDVYRSSAEVLNSPPTSTDDQLNPEQSTSTENDDDSKTLPNPSAEIAVVATVTDDVSLNPLLKKPKHNNRKHKKHKNKKDKQQQEPTTNDNGTNSAAAPLNIDNADGENLVVTTTDEVPSLETQQETFNNISVADIPSVATQ